MAFRPGGEYLPFGWVDEGKLLLFVKTRVAERAPRKGSRLAAEKKRRLEEEAEDSKKNKRRRQEAGTKAEVEEGLGGPEALMAETTSPSLSCSLCITQSVATSLLSCSSGPTRSLRSYTPRRCYITWRLKR